MDYSPGWIRSRTRTARLPRYWPDFAMNFGMPLYEVVALPEYSSHELRLSSNSEDFALFAFTFGAYEEGP